MKTSSNSECINGYFFPEKYFQIIGMKGDKNSDKSFHEKFNELLLSADLNLALSKNIPKSSEEKKVKDHIGKDDNEREDGPNEEFIEEDPNWSKEESSGHPKKEKLKNPPKKD